jgi:hypothetical protein
MDILSGPRTRGSSKVLRVSALLFPPPFQVTMSELVVTALSTTAVTATTDPTVSQYDDTFGVAFKDFEKLMGQDYKPTNFKSSEAVLEELDKTVRLFDGFRAGNEGLKTWLESYVDLLFMVSESVWEATQAVSLTHDPLLPCYCI